MMNVTDYTNIKTLLVKFKEKSDVLYAKAAALSNYATIEWVGTQIPSVGNGTVTIKQNGTSKGSFSMNQSGGATINLTDTTYSSLSAVSGGTDKSLVTTGEKYTWNNKWDYNATTIAGVKVNNAVAADKAPWSGITGKPTTLSGYGITDASRFFRYTIPASGNKGVRITFTSGEPVKITVSGANQGAQLVLIGTGYGEGGFVRNNFTEVVPSTNALYTWCVSEKDARSVEIFSARSVPDVVTVESPSLVTFTAISALSTDAVSRHLLTSANYSSYALPLTGGVMNGAIIFHTASGFPSASNAMWGDSSGLFFKTAGAFNVYSNNAWHHIYHEGNCNNYTTDWKSNVMVSMGISSPYSDVFDANNPDRWINSNYGSAGKDYSNMPDGWKYGTVLTIGQHSYRGINGNLNAQFVWDVQSGADANNPGKLWWRTKNANTGWKNWKEIYHAGNCNLSTVPWTCSSLTANGHVIAKNVLFGQSLEFSNIGSSAGHGGYIDFHYNGNTADYTSRIIEDAAGQLTLSAGIVNIGTAAKGFLYMLRPSSNYIWANTAGGELCIGTADGGETSALNSGINIIGKKVYIGGTQTGNDALNVKGDVKATGWCKATNGLLIEESGVYYTHHSQFGEIDIVRGNEFIWGGQTDTLYFNYRPSANKTTTVAHYVWNAGSSTTYATHTMGTLTVLGAITATTTIYAKTGIYTGGYISAKQASTSSDRRLKKDFCKIDNALKYVLKTRYTRFRWKDDNKESIGIIAQEEQNREYGFLVQNNEKIGHLTYDYAASTALLGAAIQEEDSKVEKLKKRVAELEKELSNLKRKWQH